MNQANIANATLNRSTYKYAKNPATGRWELKPGANERSADYYGTLKLDVGHPDGPVVIELSGWIHTKKDGSGDKFLSISGKIGKNETRTLAVAAALPSVSADTPSTTDAVAPLDDSDLPF